MRMEQSFGRRSMDKILSGVRIVDLTQLLPGPLATMYLGDYGAEVIKIENPRLGDGTRYMGSRLDSEGDTQNESPLFGMLNRNKKSLTLNLKREEGREVFHALLEKADVLVEGFRPMSMQKMGLGYEDLKDKFPRLIYVTLSGYGGTGPMKNFAGHDGNYTSYAGLMSLNVDAQGKPVLPAYQVADIGGGTLMAMSGILAALYHREKTGKGQHVDIGMADGAVSFLPLFLAESMASSSPLDPRQWILSGALPNYQIYETKDGRHLMLAALEERFFRNFLKAVEREDLLGKYTLTEDNFVYLKREVGNIFREKNFVEWTPYFANPDICLSPVATPEEAMQNPQFLEREMFFRMPDGRGNSLLQMGNPIKFSSQKEIPKNPPPAQGEHTREILDWLGFSPERMEELKKGNIV